MSPDRARVQRQPRLLSLLFRAFVLPYRHPVRAATCGLVPFVLLLCGAVLFLGANVIGGDPHPVGMGLSFPINNPIGGRTEAMHWLRTLPGFPIAHWTVWLISVALLAFWFCTWQRGVIADFAEPTEDWLRGSLTHTARYLAAMAVWFFLPLLVFKGLHEVSDWVVFDWMKLKHYDVLVGGEEWPWLLAMVAFVGIPSVWLFARLSLLPPMVATQGWPGSLRAAWSFGSNRNLSLFSSYLFCLVVGQVLAFGIAGPVFRIARIVTPVPPPDPEGSLLPTMNYLGGLARPIWAVNDALTMLALLWCATLAALIVRQTLGTPPPEAQVFD